MKLKDGSIQPKFELKIALIELCTKQNNNTNQYIHSLQSPEWQPLLQNTKNKQNQQINFTDLVDLSPIIHRILKQFQLIKSLQ
jgi:hypothetical protein